MQRRNRDGALRVLGNQQSKSRLMIGCNFLTSDMLYQIWNLPLASEISDLITSKVC